MAERLRGTLPPGVLGERRAQGLSDEAAQLAMAALRYQSKTVTAHDVDVDLGEGRRLTGTVAPVYSRGIVSVTYSRLAPKHILQAWISLVALGAARTRLRGGVHRPRREGEITSRVFGLPPDPVAVLNSLVAIFDAGRREPLPLPLKASCAWAEKRNSRRDPVAYARHKWEDGIAPERDDRAYVRMWGPESKFSVLLKDSPRPGERVDDEDTRFGALSAAPVAAGARRRAEHLMERFDLLGDLPAPRTTTVLEASAGTGKTFALAGLVTRYLAEGIATLDQMLLITFSRAASRELRERVRGQIVQAAAALEERPAETTDLVEHLLAGTAEDRRNGCPVCATR